jgi:hypothetical protein
MVVSKNIKPSRQVWAQCCLRLLCGCVIKTPCNRGWSRPLPAASSPPHVCTRTAWPCRTEAAWARPNHTSNIPVGPFLTADQLGRNAHGGSRHAASCSLLWTLRRSTRFGSIGPRMTRLRRAGTGRATPTKCGHIALIRTPTVVR